MRYKLNTSIISTACIVGMCLMPVMARADGDPAEAALDLDALVRETSPGTLLPDEQGTTSEEAVATVTADGDFLLPTYLLPGETAEIERTTTVETIKNPQPASVEPIVIPTPAPGTETIVRTKTTTVTNIEPAQVIPVQIPVVQQESPEQPPVRLGAGSRKVVAIEEEIEADPNIFDEVVDSRPVARQVVDDKPVPVHSAGGKLLIPLAGVPQAKEVAEPAIPNKKRVIIPSEYADQVAGRLQRNVTGEFKMPNEMRITFYPRASAFSGQTLKWVRAFAWAALRDPRLVVEIRASCAEADLQDRRLALVTGVLREVGLSTHQIVINYTDRPVDTMLLRAIPKKEVSETVVVPKATTAAKNELQVKKW